MLKYYNFLLLINQLITLVSLSSLLPTHSSTPGACVVASITVVNHKEYYISHHWQRCVVVDNSLQIVCLMMAWLHPIDRNQPIMSALFWSLIALSIMPA